MRTREGGHPITSDCKACKSLSIGWVCVCSAGTRKSEGLFCSDSSFTASLPPSPSALQVIEGTVEALEHARTVQDTLVEDEDTVAPHHPSSC